MSEDARPPERPQPFPKHEVRRVRVTISGRVQGVAYRYHTQQMARSLGIAGWVRNLPDGCVEAIFESNIEVLDRIVQWCRRGSPVAEVREVVVEDLTDADGVMEVPRGFEIRY